MTALTGFLTGTTDSLVATAKQLTNAAPAAGTSVASGQFAKNGTGWSELFALGGNAALTTSTPDPIAASGHGFIWDVTTLEGQTIQAGTWTATIRLSSVAIGFTVSAFARAWKRSSGGVFTQIGSDITVVTGFATTTSLVASSGSGSLPAASFVTGDKLYLDVVLNITTGSGNNTATNRVINLGENSGANDAAVTPGFIVSPPTNMDFVAPRLPPRHYTPPVRGRF